jgi:hypothetical protein
VSLDLATSALLQWSKPAADRPGLEGEAVAGVPCPVKPNPGPRCPGRSQLVGTVPSTPPSRPPSDPPPPTAICDSGAADPGGAGGRDAGYPSPAGQAKEVRVGFEDRGKKAIHRSPLSPA